MSVLAGLVRAICASLVLFGTAAAAVPLPEQIEDGRAWQQQGQGEARWWGLSLYQAALWTPPGGWSERRPYALALRYARDFSGERLVTVSIDEIERLFAPDPEQLLRWREQLARAFPDVRAGDVLVGVHRPGRGAAFYFGERLHYETSDAELAAHFFAIWLDPRTRSPNLREQLLGQAGSN